MRSRTFTIYVPVNWHGVIFTSCASEKAFRAKHLMSHAKDQSWRSLHKAGFRIVKFTGKRKAEGGAK